MMSAKTIDIDQVAHLARLQLSPEERERFGRELVRVLDYMAILERADTRDVEPTAHPFATEMPLRQDDVGPTLEHAAALSVAPETDGEAYLVPRVV
jgi:aspartyl-tRNA(Asn)/glutamyl-tRNA(Gln) amidotransferase subunit C